MNIVLTCSVKWQLQLLVLLYSLRESMPNEELSVFLILPPGDYECYKNSIIEFEVRIRHDYGINLRCTAMSKEVDDYLSNLITNKDYLDNIKPVGAYRLFIHWMFNFDRCLYLDTDIIVQKNLVDFYNQDFECNYLVARYEDKEEAYGEGELKKINSGVGLLNLKAIREDKSILDKLWEYCIKLRDDTFFDQTILSKVYEGKIKFCDKKYNHYLMDTDLSPYDNYDESYILHFVGLKPWNNYKPDGESKWYYWYKYVNKLEGK